MAEPRQHRRYTRRQKATAVIAAELTSIQATSEAQGIPKRTIAYWLDKPEYAQLRAKTREQMAEGMATIAHLAAERIIERLPEFEPRDLVILLGVAIDKAQLLAGQATARTEHRELLSDFDDHEREAMSAWLHDLAKERLAADAGS